jgi:hypothetical protein
VAEAKAPARPSGQPSLRRAAWRLGLLLAASYAYFLPKPAWNEISRFDLVRALVERGSVNIDPDHPNTEDKARYQEHYYSDKAPGAALLATPAYAGYLGWLKLRGGARPQWLFEWQLRRSDRHDAVNGTLRGSRTPRDELRAAKPRSAHASAPPAAGDRQPVVFNDAFLRGVYVCNLFTGVPAGAACGVLLFLLLVRGGVGPDRALASTLALALGSPFFAYATMFFGHVLAGAFLLGAFALLSPAFQQDPTRGRSSTPGRLLAAGALLGLAVLTELPAVLGAAVLAVYAANRAGQGGRLRALALLAAGALPPLAVLGAYHTAAFGHPLRTGYAHVVYPTFAAGMASGWLGISWPRPAALFGMLMGRSRGLLYLSPVLALGFVGLVRGVRHGLLRFIIAGPSEGPAPPAMSSARRSRAPLDALTVVPLAVVIAFMLLNASYYMWWGGAALGPRHLVPALPFLAMGLPLAFQRERLWWGVAGPLLLISVVNQLVAVAVSTLVPFGPDVLFEHAYPHLLAGRVAILPGASNLGLILGLRGWASLLPLVALWLFGVVAMVRVLPRHERAAAA